MSPGEDYLDVIDDPAGEQHALAVGAGIAILDDYDTVAVTGPDRRSWLTTLSSQIVAEDGEDAGELLFLDAQGHIMHAAGLVDDGTTAWLLTDRGRGRGLAAFLDSMRFLLRVEVADCSDEVCQVAMSATGPIACAAEAVDDPSILARWRDPWPGVCPGGATYFVGSHHPGHDWAAAILLVARDRVEAEVAHLCERASQQAPFPLTTDDGYPVAAPRVVGRAAWEARRIACWRPRVGREVDARALPHELDWLRTAVHLNKGCYCGQETVARIVNLGRPPRRLVACAFDGAESLLPPPGAEITVAGRRIGHVTSTARDAWEGPVGLGLVKRAAREAQAQVRWSDDGGEHEVAVALTPIVAESGRCDASPAQRPGQGISRLDGAPGGMRLGASS